MNMIDIHSHWGTRRGYTLRTPEELAQQKKTWNSEPTYHTEQEMADYFRRSGVRVVLDFGFTKFFSLSEAREVHDYGFGTEHQASWASPCRAPEAARPATRSGSRSMRCAPRRAFRC